MSTHIPRIHQFTQLVSVASMHLLSKSPMFLPAKLQTPQCITKVKLQPAMRLLDVLYLIIT
jgi:hypothetical protein